MRTGYNFAVGRTVCLCTHLRVRFVLRVGEATELGFEDCVTFKAHSVRVDHECSRLTVTRCKDLLKPRPTSMKVFGVAAPNTMGATLRGIRNTQFDQQ